WGAGPLPGPVERPCSWDLCQAQGSPFRQSLVPVVPMELPAVLPCLGRALRVQASGMRPGLSGMVRTQVRVRVMATGPFRQGLAGELPELVCPGQPLPARLSVKVAQPSRGRLPALGRLAASLECG